MNIGKHPYVFYLLALVSGIFLCENISFSIYYISVLLGILLLFLVFIVYSIRFRILFSLVALLCWSLIGILLVELNIYISKNHYINYQEKDKIQMLSVSIKEQNNSNGKDRKYTAEVKSVSYKDKRINSSGDILLLVNKEQFKSVLVLGNEYTLLVKMKEPVTTMNPHQFNYKKYLKQNYILQMGSVEKIISESAHSSIIYKIKNFNQNLIKKVDKSGLKEDSKEFLKAFLLGDRSDMKKDSIDAYSKSGIMHLIAISGMHVAFIFGIIFSGLSFLFKNRKRKLIIIISLLFVWVFGCLVGLTSSVFRSCLMITIYYCFELLKRTSNIYHSMALSAIIILLCNPYEIYSIGFQLSYVAVFFICWLTPAFIKHFRTKNKTINNWIINPLSVTIAAQIGTLPFVLFYFHQFSLLSIPANIIIIPYTFIITYSSLFEIVITQLPLEYQFYGSLCYDFMVKFLVDATRYISLIDIFMFKNIPLNLWELISLVLALIFFRDYLFTLKVRALYPFLICILFFQASILYNDCIASEKKELIVFHHKKILIGFREGKKLLVIRDSTDTWKITKDYIIAPYITGERIETIEYKFLNHQNIYKWEGKYIQVLSKNSSNISDLASYIVTTELLNPNLNNQKKIIITGNNYLYKKKQENKYPLNWWVTAKNGVFMIPF